MASYNTQFDNFDNDLMNFLNSNPETTDVHLKALEEERNRFDEERQRTADNQNHSPNLNAVGLGPFVLMMLISAITKSCLLTLIIGAVIILFIVFLLVNSHSND